MIYKFLKQINLTIYRAPVKKIHSDMNKNIDFYAPEAVILICAIIIASIGLNLGSTAVVIGAMLISPIMGPIQSIAYAAVIGDTNLLKRAIYRVSSMVLIAIFASIIYFVLSPLNAPSDEIIARTNPTFWDDLLIAIFGGLAGIIGVTRTEKTNVVPGVIIATALMPPLCTVGFGIAHLNSSIIFGAFYLFIINSFFILLGSLLGFLLMGIRNNKNNPVVINVKTRFRIQLIIIIMVVPSIIAGYQMIIQEVVTSNVTNLVQTEIETDSRKVVNTEIDYENMTIDLIIVGNPITKNELSKLEGELIDYNLGDYKINIVQSSITNTIINTIKNDNILEK